MLDDKRLEEIRERCDKATKGPWYSMKNAVTDPQNPVWLIFENSTPGVLCGRGPCGGNPTPMVNSSEQDANFIAHARTDIPELLAEIERLRGELAKK